MITRKDKQSGDAAFGAAIVQIINRHFGGNQTHLAAALRTKGYKASQQKLSNWKKGSRPRDYPQFISALRKLGVDEQSLAQLDGQEISSGGELNSMDIPSKIVNPYGYPSRAPARAPNQSGTRGHVIGIPLHASAPGPGKGWVMLRNHSSIIDMLPELATVPNPRAYFMMGDEMEPTLNNGAILYPHPEKLPKMRSIVMITLKAFPDEWFARELVGRDVSQITVRKYGTGLAPEDTIIDWADVASMTVAIVER